MTVKRGSTDERMAGFVEWLSQSGSSHSMTLVADHGFFGQAAGVAYGLSFGSDFFWNERRDAVLPHVLRQRPTSVEQAVSQLSEETWTRLAREVFGCEPEYLSTEEVLHKIEETNTCLNLDPPVEILIDSDGEFTVLVHDRVG